MLIRILGNISPPGEAIYLGSKGSNFSLYSRKPENYKNVPVAEDEGPNRFHKGVRACLKAGKGRHTEIEPPISSL